MRADCQTCRKSNVSCFRASCHFCDFKLTFCKKTACRERGNFELGHHAALCEAKRVTECRSLEDLFALTDPRTPTPCGTQRPGLEVISEDLGDL